MKISIIGGGSSYTPELLDGLLDRASSLGCTAIALCDIDAARLETVSGFCRRMAAEKKTGAGIETTTDLDRAVSGASFVVAQIRVGGNTARREDERLGMRHSLIGQETTGVGGFGKALRTIPAMLKICAAIKKESANAWLINFTNPSGIVTEAILNHSRVKAVGLCNIPITFHVEVAKALGAERQDVTLDYIGLNHLSWVRKISLRGEDVTDKVIALAGDAARPANIDELDYPPALLRALHAIPMHYLRYYYLTSAMIEEQNKKEKTRAEQVMEIEAELFKVYADPSASVKPESLGKRGGAHYSLAALELIEAIHFNRGETQVLNVKNGVTIAGLPEESVVEVPCRVGSQGPRPLPIEQPGPEIMGLMRAVKAYEQLAVKAAVTRDYDAALLALVAHPLGPEADKAEQVLQDIMQTHGLSFDNQP